MPRLPDSFSLSSFLSSLSLFLFIFFCFAKSTRFADFCNTRDSLILSLTNFEHDTYCARRNFRSRYATRTHRPPHAARRTFGPPPDILEVQYGVRGHVVEAAIRGPVIDGGPRTFGSALCGSGAHRREGVGQGSWVSDASSSSACEAGAAGGRDDAQADGGS